LQSRQSRPSDDGKSFVSSRHVGARTIGMRGTICKGRTCAATTRQSGQTCLKSPKSPRSRRYYDERGTGAPPRCWLTWRLKDVFR
jgi:hypothetical protein